MRDADDIVIDRINKQRKQDEIDKIANLRDEFAKTAMLGYMNDCYDLNCHDRATFAYEQADAMLKARQQ